MAERRFTCSRIRFTGLKTKLPRGHFIGPMGRLPAHHAYAAVLGELQRGNINSNCYIRRNSLCSLHPARFDSWSCAYKGSDKSWFIAMIDDARSCASVTIVYVPKATWNYCKWLNNELISLFPLPRYLLFKSTWSRVCLRESPITS